MDIALPVPMCIMVHMYLNGKFEKMRSLLCPKKMKSQSDSQHVKLATPCRFYHNSTLLLQHKSIHLKFAKMCYIEPYLWKLKCEFHIKIHMSSIIIFPNYISHLYLYFTSYGINVHIISFKKPKGRQVLDWLILKHRIPFVNQSVMVGSLGHRSGMRQWLQVFLVSIY